MKKSFYILFVFFLFIGIHPSCTNDKNKDPLVTVTLDFSDSIVSIINKDKLVQLESSDSTLLYAISSIEKRDTVLYLRSRSFLRAYNANTGKFLFNISSKGEGPGEYLFISHFWASGDTLNAYDAQLHKILRYDRNGDFLEYKNVNYIPDNKNDFIPTPGYMIESYDDKGYYSINTYMDIAHSNVPTLSRFDSNLNFTDTVIGRVLTTGSFMDDRAYADKRNKRLLVWEPLKDTLFVVKDNHILPLYAFDFGRNATPSEVQNKKEFYERVNAFKEGKNVPYAGFMRWFQVKDNKLYFIFYDSLEKTYLGMYDENSKSTKIHSIHSADNRYQLTAPFKIIGDSIIMTFSDKWDSEKNPLLLTESLDFIDK